MITATEQLAAEMMAQAAQLRRTAQSLTLQAKEIESKFAPKKKKRFICPNLVAVSKSMGDKR